MKSVSLVVFDFDGVMTDNHVWVHQSGAEAVRCHRGDGLAISRLKKAGFEVLVLSTEANPVVAARCRKLEIEVVQDCDDKLIVLQRLARSRSLDPGQIAYVGNDLNDVECLRWVGWPIAVADARPEVHALAKWVTRLPGGRGAVREVADRLVRLRNDTDPAVDWIMERIWKSIEITQTIGNSDTVLAQILRVARTLTAVLRADGRIFLFGDEDSAADVQYLTAQLGRAVTTESPLSIVALNVGNSPVTSIDDIFHRTLGDQLETQARAGDMAIGISINGDSPQVVHAMETGCRIGLRSVFVTGRAGHTLAGIAEECIAIPSGRGPCTREAHMLIGRILCEYLERARADDPPAVDRVGTEP